MWRLRWERLTPALISFPTREQWLKNKCSPSRRGPQASSLSPRAERMRKPEPCSPETRGARGAVLAPALGDCRVSWHVFPPLPGPALGQQPGQSPRDEGATAWGSALSALAAPSAQRPGAGQSLTPASSPLAHGIPRVIRPSTSLLHGTAAEGARGCTHAGAVGCWRQRGTRLGARLTAEGQVRESRAPPGGTAPRGPGGLGKPSLTPARLLQPGPGTHAHSHLPAFSLSPATTYLPWERQLLPRLQCSRLSLQHRGEYPSATRVLRLGGGRSRGQAVCWAASLRRWSCQGWQAEKAPDPEKIPRPPPAGLVLSRTQSAS